MSPRSRLDLAWLAGATPLMTDAYWEERGVQAASLAGIGGGAVQTAEVQSGEVQSGEEQSIRPVRAVGRWFEHIHLAALRSTPGVEVLAANEQLRVGGRTLGELDVLYRKNGRVVHRETAVKFYLAATLGTDPSAWIGPGQRDRLDRKLDRLATHQLTVAEQARAEDAWPAALPFPDVSEVLLLGALFTPPDDERLPEGAHPGADRGRWYFASDFANRFGDAPWCKLDKPLWLSPEHAREMSTTSALALALDLQRPAFVACVSTDSDSHGIERAFVVPDDWGGSRASEALATPCESDDGPSSSKGGGA